MPDGGPHWRIAVEDKGVRACAVDDCMPASAIGIDLRGIEIHHPTERQGTPPIGVELEVGALPLLSHVGVRRKDGLEKLAKRISEGKLKDPEKIEQAIGRLRERHSRGARYYSIEHCDGQLLWEQLDHDLSAAANLDGCYVLQAHGPQMFAIQTWKSYMVLTKAEDGFRLRCGDRKAL